MSRAIRSGRRRGDATHHRDRVVTGPWRARRRGDATHHRDRAVTGPWRAGAGPDRTDAGGNRNAGRDGRGGATGTCHVNFLFSTLFISSSRFSSFPIVYVRQQPGRDRAGRNRTNAGGDSNEGQDRGAGGREEEVEGQAGGLRRSAS